MFVPVPPASDPPPGPTAEQASRQHHDQAAHLVLDLLEQGVPRAQVYQRLLQRGYDADLAAEVVNRLAENDLGEHHADPIPPEHRKALKQQGEKNMAIGGLVCLVGTVITLFTLWTATVGGGGSYVIAWGAMIFGAVQFFRGLSQVSMAKR